MEAHKGKNKNPPAKAQLINLINGMSEARCRKFLGYLEAWRNRDRRGNPRTSCAVPVDYTAGNRVFKDFIQDISAGGIFIKTPTAFSKGQEITLAFMPPGRHKPVRISGEIVRRSSKGIGVQFSQPEKAPETSSASDSCQKAVAMGKDRRKGPRLDFHCPVLIQGIEGEYTITDISLEGAFIRSEASLESRLTTGKALHLLIRLPTEDEPTEVMAHVANIRRHGIGCKFVGLTKNSKDAIHRCFNVAKHSIPLS